MGRNVPKVTESSHYFLVGTGNGHDPFHGTVEQVAFLCISSLIVDLLALPAGRDQALTLQLTQMVGDRRTGHIHKGRNIDDALFAMAKQPENPHAAGIGQLFEHIRNDLKIIHPLELPGEFFRFMGMGMLMG